MEKKESNKRDGANSPESGHHQTVINKVWIRLPVKIPHSKRIDQFDRGDDV